jgi:hypothetical protein
MVAYGVLSALVLLWLGVRLARDSGNVPLRTVTSMVACLAVAFPFGTASDHGIVVAGLPPMISRLIQHVVLLLGVYSLVSFFLFSALDRRSAWRRAAWYAIPLLVAELVLIVSAVRTPPGARTNDHSVPSVALFFITADLYMAVGFAMACVWTRRYARAAAPRVARGLRVASVGLAAIVLANCVFVPAVALRWIGGSDSPEVVARTGAADTVIGALAASILLLPGILVFLIGVTYPAAAMRLAALRIWWRHRREYRQLAPLWTALHTEFPDDELQRVPGKQWQDAFQLRGTHRRYYRRVVECRDGLVRISPYLDPAPAGDLDHHELAGRLARALASHAARRRPVPSQAMPVALPVGDGLDADVHELVRLSTALNPTGAS